MYVKSVSWGSLGRTVSSMPNIIDTLGKFQNLDPNFVTFFDVLRHFSAHTENFKYRNRDLDKIAVILVVDLVLYVQY